MAVVGGDTRHSSPPLLRKGVPGEKKPLKEKLIAYYEVIFEVTAYIGNVNIPERYLANIMVPIISFRTGF